MDCRGTGRSRREFLPGRGDYAGCERLTTAQSFASGLSILGGTDIPVANGFPTLGPFTSVASVRDGMVRPDTNGSGARGIVRIWLFYPRWDGYAGCERFRGPGHRSHPRFPSSAEQIYQLRTIVKHAGPFASGSSIPGGMVRPDVNDSGARALLTTGAFIRVRTNKPVVNDVPAQTHATNQLPCLVTCHRNR